MKVFPTIAAILWLTIPVGCGSGEQPANQTENENSDSVLQIAEAQENLKVLQQKLDQDPANYDAWQEKGELLAFLKDTAGAIRALEISFYNYPLLTNGIVLANLYAETKNEKAVELCNRLLATDTTRELADPYYIKGNYYSRIGDTSRAMMQYDSCILREWKFTEAYIDKGILLFKQNKLPEAQQTFELAVTVSNTYPDAYFWIGRCQEAKGAISEAIENYRNALALDPSFKQARERINNLEK